MQHSFYKKITLLILILLSISGGLFFILNTEPGLQLVFSIAQKLTPGKLTVQKLHGRLLGSIEAEQIHLQNKKLKLDLSKLSLQWQPQDLLIGKVQITSLDLNNLKINTTAKHKPKQKTEESTRMKTPSLPFTLVFDKAQIENLSWQQDTSSPIKIANTVLQLHIDQQGIKNLKCELHVTNSSSISLQGSLQKTLDLNWQIDIKNLKDLLAETTGSITSQGRIYGALANPTVDSLLKIKNFRYNDISWKNLESKSRLDLSTEKDSQLDLAITSPKIGAINLNRFICHGKTSSLGLNLNIDPISISFADTNMPPLKLAKTTVEGIFNTQGLTTKTTFVIQEKNPFIINCNFPKLKKLAGLLNEQPVSGDLAWQTDNLSFLPAIIPNIKNTNGTLNINYTFSGTTKNLKTDGVTKLTHLNTQIPDLNIKLQNTSLDVQQQNNKVEYKGAIHSGNGTLNISGNTSLSQDTITSQNSITGKDFLAINTREYLAVISPQLTLQNDNKEWQLKGKVDLPKAIIKPNDLDYNNPLPSEIVYVGKTKKEDNKFEDLNLNTSIQLNLGNEISVDIMGLTGKVEGQLHLTDDAKKTTNATGKLFIKNGNYNAFSQELKITKGILNFLGGPATNPEVNIEATRSFKTTGDMGNFSSLNKELTVGVRMQGLLDTPKTELFSVPSGMTKPDILSYLLTGQSSKQASQNTAQLLFQAAYALNFKEMRQSAGLVNTIKDKLQLSEFGFTKEVSSIQPQDTDSKTKPSGKKSLATTTAFALGKFLSTRLYVGYARGIIEPVNIFRIKYYLGRYWIIQSESSTISNSVDILYVIEPK